MQAATLLIVDKDHAARALIRQHAESEGYRCDEAADGIAALKLFRRREYDLVVLDTELPELDGRNVCRQIRKVSDIPILIVTAKGDEGHRLSGFELGADDYITKPFSPSELMARIRVFLYRSGTLQKPRPQKIAYGGLLIDAVSRTVYIDDHAVQLPPKEYELLCFLSQNPNQAFARDMLLDQVWGADFFGSDRTVDTHIKTLRESIRPYDSYIVTVWGIGYKFAV